MYFLTHIAKSIFLACSISTCIWRCAKVALSFVTHKIIIESLLLVADKLTCILPTLSVTKIADAIAIYTYWLQILQCSFFQWYIQLNGYVDRKQLSQHLTYTWFCNELESYILYEVFYLDLYLIDPALGRLYV